MFKKSLIVASLSLLVLSSLNVAARAAVSVGLSANEQGINSFYLDIGNYYQVPQAQVQMVRERRIPDDEAPVALYLAQQAHVSPDIIVSQRLAGRSWMNIALGFHLNAASFYFPMDVEPGGPYARTYARFRVQRNRWGAIRLGDEEIVNMVNLRFASQHYGYRPEEVATMRSGGRHYYELSRQRRARKQVSNQDPGQIQGPQQPQDNQQGQGNSVRRGRGNGRGNGKGKGKGKGVGESQSNGHGPSQDAGQKH